MGPAWIAPVSAPNGALLGGAKKATGYLSLWRGLTERRNYASRTAHRRTCRSCRQTTASLLVFFIRAPPYAKMLLLYHVFEKAQPAFLEGVRVTFPHLSLAGYAARGRLNLEFGPVIECSSGTSFFQPSLRDGVGYLRGCTGVETPAYFQPSLRDGVGYLRGCTGVEGALRRPTAYFQPSLRDEGDGRAERGILPRLLSHYFQASLRDGETTMQKSESHPSRGGLCIFPGLCMKAMANHIGPLALLP
ncbi:MAG: hypothetical protein BWY63_01263 [Chloroflexi bacterium ADurb.Bin360]|nr:MAG: hypothetical protein BWY63_01263 [Chloroflexi bacterium ADurb.Bin360]